MGEEAYDEVDIAAADESDVRTLVIRGGYSREKVYVGICRSKDDQPNEIIAVDGAALLRALSSMDIAVHCSRCDRLVEDARRYYAVPFCYACLPP